MDPIDSGRDETQIHYTISLNCFGTRKAHLNVFLDLSADGPVIAIRNICQWIDIRRGADCEQWRELYLY